MKKVKKKSARERALACNVIVVSVIDVRGGVDNENDADDDDD